ncbi:MAG TPA: hypothetical protein VEW26_06865 [Allosphingosinicella sp.]|nr:hypothetical protein [Allosphingosinicella sp.]
MAETIGSEMTKGDNPAPVTLFRGYDTVARGMLTGCAVKGGFENTGEGGTIRVEVCESLSQLAEALEIDASLSVSYLKAAKVTAKMEFAKKLDVTARSVSIVVYASRRTGTWTAKGVELEKGVAAPTDDDSAADFAQSYGDSFISSVTLGSEYFAVYIFRTETREEQQELATSLRGKIGGGSTVKAGAQVKLSNFLKETKTNWTLRQEINGANAAFPDETQLIEFARNFSKLTPGAPVTTGIKVSGYESVQKFGRKFAPVVRNRRYFLNSDDGLLGSLARLTAVRNQVSWLRRIYDRYNYQGDPALLTFETKLVADIRAINRQIEAWEDDAAGKFVAPALPSLEAGEPVLQFEEGSKSWGGTAPGPWIVDSIGEMIRNRTRIQSIQIGSGKFDDRDLLTRFDIQYASDKRNWPEKHGNENPAFWGQKLTVEEGKFLVRLEIRWGRYVDWIRVHLSNGRSTEAGGGGGGYEDWKVPDGWFVVGFTGRSGLVIDQLEVLYAKLNPARMVRPN